MRFSRTKGSNPCRPPKKFERGGCERQPLPCFTVANTYRSNRPWSLTLVDTEQHLSALRRIYGRWVVNAWTRLVTETAQFWYCPNVKTR